MKLIELIDKYISEKKRCFVNGIPDSDTKGTIIARGDDYIEFETLKIETEKKTQKEKTIREVIIMPIGCIETISLGQETKEINTLDRAMKALEE